MQADNYSQQLEEELSFIKQIDYIKAVLDNTLNLDKLDRNDLYELVYINEKLNKWLKIGIVNTDTYSAVKDLSEKVSFIVDNLSNETLEKALEAKIDTTKSKKINIKKYNETTKLTYLKDRSDTVKRKANADSIYARLRIQSLLIIAIVMLIVMTGLPFKLTKIMTNLFGSITNSEETTVEISEALNENVTSSTELVNAVSQVTSTLIGMLLVLVITLSIIILCFDIMILRFPEFRKLLESRGINISSFTSSEAREALELSDYLPNKLEYKSIGLSDKLEISTVLLNNMKVYVNEYEEYFNRHITTNDYLTKTYGNAGNLSNILEVLHTNASIQEGVDKIKGLAKTELIYDDFSDIVEKIDGLKDNRLYLHNKEVQKDIDSILRREVTTNEHQDR